MVERVEKKVERSGRRGRWGEAEGVEEEGGGGRECSTGWKGGVSEWRRRRIGGKEGGGTFVGGHGGGDGGDGRGKKRREEGEGLLSEWVVVDFGYCRQLGRCVWWDGRLLLVERFESGRISLVRLAWSNCFQLCLAFGMV